MNRWWRLFRHRWMDPGDSRRAVPDDMAERLAARVRASEARHTGEVRLLVEAGLPTSYVLRVHNDAALAAVVRERALAWFGRLRLWDTEHNNGVLIYLLLAENAIEFVADRGLARHVPPSAWQAIVDRLGTRLRAGEVEDGLTQALEEVSALLVMHCPAGPGVPAHNELPDEVLRV
ncbi:TPM domain-containing protein [Hydrogenophaga crocea]|uniref:TPM domain-containing protein n=1 Tax=Hydrogenophaga crocea TaxID=2716225 RepID=A0A6G8IK44_9BURK|nr:TPM domain-containing protein [Hydrogenophaga crocea]QIM53531.1 TPM domain-containing protein [Hydrogenophaga crocea]